MSSERAWIMGWITVALATCQPLTARPPVDIQERPTFRSGVDLVTIDASVHGDDGAPVPNLTSDDFRLEVDGRPRRIVSAQFVSLDAPSEPVPSRPTGHFSSNEGIDTGRVVIVAVDESHIRRLEGTHALVAATRFIESLPPSDRVGVVGLSSADRVTLSRDRAALRRHLESLRGTGDPMTQSLNLGISEALEIADGSRSRLADAVLRECGRALTEYVNTNRAADDAAGGGRDACPEQVEQESRAIAQFAHMQAGLSIAGLQALVTRLKDLPGPKTVVLVSEGLVIDPRRVDLSRLAADAQAARVTIYGLQIEVPAFDASQDRQSPTATRDLHVRHDGVARVAGAARGMVVRQVGTDPRPFERIARELSGYYLLAFEASDGDRDGRPHRVRVSLHRRRGELRARTTFTLPAPSRAGRGAELTSLLRTLQPATELPLRVATYAYAEPGGRARVVISAEAGTTRTPSGTALGFVLIDDAGVIAATAAHDARDGRHAFSAVVAPGSYTLRAAAIDQFGRQGSVQRVFNVRPAAPDALQVGDLMLAPPPLSPGEALHPFVDGVSGPVIVAYLETHRQGRAPGPDQVRMHVSTSEAGSPAVSATADLSGTGAGRSIARATLPIASLAPGSYYARAEVVVRGEVVARTARPFTIVP